MNNSSSKFVSGFKYVYLVVFFALLSGFFYPLITDTSFDSVIVGILVLFLGLAGGVLLYKSANSEENQAKFLAGGFILIAISLFYIFQLADRF